MKNILIILLLIVAFIGGYLFSQKFNLNITLTKSQAITPTAVSIVGNDIDSHGCKGSAGYSWCENKKKCLRVWEESCESKAPTIEVINDADLKLIIKQLLIDIHGQSANELTITISQRDGEFAKGGALAPGGGGMWLATKVNDKWTLIFEGNGAPDCQFIKSFNFPSSMLINVCD